MRSFASSIFINVVKGSCSRRATLSRRAAEVENFADGDDEETAEDLAALQEARPSTWCNMTEGNLQKEPVTLDFFSFRYSE